MVLLLNGILVALLKRAEFQGLAKLDNIVREHVSHNVGECSWTFHVVDRSGQIGKHCSPTNSIRHKLNAVNVVLAAV